MVLTNKLYSRIKNMSLKKMSEIIEIFFFNILIIYLDYKYYITNIG